MLIVSQRKIDPGITVIEASGRITLGRNSQELEWELDEVIKTEPVRVIIDLSNVAHVDSTGVGILVMCAGKVNERGGKIRIAGAMGTVEHTLKLCKLSDIVPLCASVHDAVASLTGTGAVA